MAALWVPTPLLIVVGIFSTLPCLLLLSFWVQSIISGCVLCLEGGLTLRGAVVFSPSKDLQRGPRAKDGWNTPHLPT